MRYLNSFHALRPRQLVRSCHQAFLSSSLPSPFAALCSLLPPSTTHTHQATAFFSSKTKRKARKLKKKQHSAVPPVQISAEERKARRLQPLSKPPLTGTVLSRRMQKTVMVNIERTVKVPKLGKYIVKRRRFPVHDEVSAT